MAATTLIVIPTYEERENIVSLIDRLFELHADLDILVVDDNSQDGTADAVKEAQEQHGERLMLRVREGKGGRGSAVLEGLKHAIDQGYSHAFEMDADFSHEPAEVQQFLEMMTEHDLVIGSRYHPESKIYNWSRKRIIFSDFANRFARMILRIPITDYTNGYRCYNQTALQALNFDAIEAKGYIVLSEVAYQLHRKNLRIGEVPTVFVNRQRGTSNLSAREVKEAFLSVLAIRYPRLRRVLQKQIQ